MKAVLLFATTQIKRFFRDPTALFFTLAFPLIFLFVFGSIFRGSDGVSFDVAIINHSETPFAKEFLGQFEKNETFKIRDDVTSLDQAKELMGRSEIDSIIEVPESFGAPGARELPAGELVVYYDEGSPDSGRTVASVMESILTEIEQGMTKQQPLFSVKQAPTSVSGLSQFDYTISGLIGFSLLSIGIFGLANQLPAEKKNGTLRRIRATPMARSR